MDEAVKTGEKLAFSDDQIRSALALLTAQTGDADEAFRRLQVAQDLSRGANIDLETASKLLGKATEENVQVLKRYGINVKDGATVTEMLGEVQKKFGGQSEAFAKTAAGKWQILTNQIGNVKEAIGGALLPVATKVFGVLGTFLTDHMADFEAFGQRVVDLGEKGFKAAMPYIENFGQLLKNDIIPWIKNDLLPALKNIGEFLRDKVIPWMMDFSKIALEMGKGIAQFLAPALDTLSDLWANLWPVLEEHVIPVLKRVGEFLTEHKELIIAAAGVILLLTNPWLAVAAAILVVLAKWDDISKFFTDTGKAIDTFIDKVGEIPIIGEIFKMVWDDVVLIVKTAWEAIKIQVETAINVIRDVIKIVTALIHGDWEEAWKGIKQLFTDVWDGITGLVGVYFDAIWGIFQNRLALLSGLWTDTWNGLTAGAEALANELANFGVRVFQWFWDLPDLMRSLGKRIVEGLWSGIESLGDWLIGKVGDLLGKIPGAAQVAGLLSRSPSPLGLDIGRGLGEGISAGFIETMGTQQAILEGAAGSLGDAIAARLAASAGVNTRQRAPGEGGYAVQRRLRRRPTTDFGARCSSHRCALAEPGTDLATRGMALREAAAEPGSETALLVRQAMHDIAAQELVPAANRTTEAVTRDLVPATRTGFVDIVTKARNTDESYLATIRNRLDILIDTINRSKPAVNIVRPEPYHRRLVTLRLTHAERPREHHRRCSWT
jgi:hypothetical protein